MSLIVTTAPPPYWPRQAMPLGPTDAPPYLLRVSDHAAAPFLEECFRCGYAAQEAANEFEAGMMLREIQEAHRNLGRF